METLSTPARVFATTVADRRECAPGAVPTGEVIRDKYRGRGVGLVQTGWAVGCTTATSCAAADRASRRPSEMRPAVGRANRSSGSI